MMRLQQNSLGLPCRSNDAKTVPMHALPGAVGIREHGTTNERIRASLPGSRQIYSCCRFK